jgi:hypothetical protein
VRAATKFVEEFRLTISTLGGFRPINSRRASERLLDTLRGWTPAPVQDRDPLQPDT